MFTTYLRRVGGSTMLAVPPALLDVLNLSADSEVGLTVENGCLIIRPHPHYTLEELLAQCDPEAEVTAEEREWLDGRPTGHELL